MTRLRLGLMLVGAMLAVAAVSLAKSFTESGVTVSITLTRTPAGAASVIATVKTAANDGTALRRLVNYDVLSVLTNAQKIQVRDAYDMMVNALAAAESIPTPVPTP